MRIAIGALLAAVAALGCRGGEPIAPSPPALDEGRFPHPLHAQIACVDCHASAAVLAGEPARPGTGDHAPCDREQCHRPAFLGRPGTLCRICHERVDPIAGTATPAPYPPQHGRRALAAEFDHAGHLDFAAVEAAVGFHVSCSDCHAGPGGEIQTASHAACSRCHAPEAAPPGAPTLFECGGCHRPRSDPPSRERELIVGDLRFAHRTHRSDRRGDRIRCVECHQDTATHDRTGEHPLPPTRACVTCHDDGSRVPREHRMRACETCHVGRRQQLGSLAPRSHLPATERPLDHTVAFRRDHDQEALRDPTRCARCHTAVSGTSRDICDECHRVSRPADHVVTWREFDHGPEAATESDRCAMCHSADYCVACHSVAPRSHFPLAGFGAGGGHGTQAMLNLRACVTCHPQQTFCSRGGCHPRGP